MYGLTAKEIDILSQRWRNVIKPSLNNGFESYSQFLKWCGESGYAYGKVLEKKDPNGPYSPDNCQWIDKPLNPATMRHAEEFIKQWDDFITPIRERYKDYRPDQLRKHKEKEYFRYEHPDLEREGIIWMP